MKTVTGLKHSNTLSIAKTTDVVNKGQKEMTMDFSATTPTWEYLPM